MARSLRLSQIIVSSFAIIQLPAGNLARAEPPPEYQMCAPWLMNPANPDAGSRAVVARIQKVTGMPQDLIINVKSGETTQLIFDHNRKICETFARATLRTEQAQLDSNMAAEQSIGGKLLDASKNIQDLTKGLAHENIADYKTTQKDLEALKKDLIALKENGAMGSSQAITTIDDTAKKFDRSINFIQNKINQEDQRATITTKAGNEIRDEKNSSLSSLGTLGLLIPKPAESEKGTSKVTGDAADPAASTPSAFEITNKNKENNPSISNAGTTESSANIATSQENLEGDSQALPEDQLSKAKDQGDKKEVIKLKLKKRLAELRSKNLLTSPLLSEGTRAQTPDGESPKASESNWYENSKAIGSVARSSFEGNGNPSIKDFVSSMLNGDRRPSASQGITNNLILDGITDQDSPSLFERVNTYLWRFYKI